MNDPDTSSTSIPRDRALVAVDPDASPEAIAERMRAWLLTIALRTRHDDGLDPDTGQPRPRRPLSLAMQDVTPFSTDSAAPLSDVEEECPHRPDRADDSTTGGER